MPPTTPTSSVLLFSLLLAACTGGSREPVDVRVTSLSPSSGTTDVSRRVVVRAAFDQDVAAASCTPATCWIERADGGGRATAAVAYDPATRLLTLAAAPALEPLTAYRVQLSRELRTADGAPFATPTSWQFTTGDAPVWDPAVDLATGTLLATRAARGGNGGVHVLWADSTGGVQLTTTDGTATTTMPVGISGATAALVCDDENGQTVVLARNQYGGLFSARRAAGEIFQQQVLVDSDVDTLLDADLRGDLMLVAMQKPGVTLLRAWRFGIGWLPPVVVPNMLPRVHVAADGTGTAVGGFHRFVPFVESTTWCRRWCVDALGAIAVCDPEPALPNAFVRASDAVFADDGRIVAAQTVDTTTSGTFATVTRLFEYLPGSGWELLPVLLGEDPAAHAITIGPGLGTAMITVDPGLRPVAWQRVKGVFAVSFLGNDAEPAPPEPATAIVLTGTSASGCLWTAATAPGPGAAARLLGATGRPWAGFGEAVEVAGPYDAATAPIRQLRAFAVGQQQALAVWAQGGVVRTARMH